MSPPPSSTAAVPGLDDVALLQAEEYILSQSKIEELVEKV